MTRRPNKQLLWLLPVALAGQYLFFRDVLKPRLDFDLARQHRADDRIWATKVGNVVCAGVTRTPGQWLTRSRVRGQVSTGPLTFKR